MEKRTTWQGIWQPLGAVLLGAILLVALLARPGWAEPNPGIDWPSFGPIFFAYNYSTQLSASARKQLDEVARFVANEPRFSLRVIGNTDERGSNEYNMSIGERMAETVMRYLVQAGVAESQIVTLSWGEEKPVDPRHTKEAWDRNRRVEIELLVDGIDPRKPATVPEQDAVR